MVFSMKIEKGRPQKMKKKEKTKATPKIKPHKIFISHSSKDANYVDVFVELLETLGMTKGQIVCSSVPSYGIPLGENIYEWLVNEFQKSELHVVYIFSKNYYSSAAALNEMGAAWAMKHKWTGILLPGFSFEQLDGCIDKNQISIKLDDPSTVMLKQRLNELKDDLVSEFELEPMDGIRWERKRDRFLEDIKRSEQEQLNETKKTRFDDLINKRSELDLLKDYTPFSKVIPIISCGDEKVAKIVTYSDHFEMNVDISGVEERNMKEFAMALMKYIPCEDLSVFHDAGYSIEFDAAATGDIKAVQLEIKDDTGAKVVDKTNDISSEKRHFRYGLKNVVRNGVALEKISEICFTVFFSKSYIDGESGTLSISNLKMAPDNSGKLIEMDS
jgi:hypothetical protein